MLPIYVLPTPSAAGELVSHDGSELLKKIATLTLRLHNALINNNSAFTQQLNHLHHRLAQVHPEQQLRVHQQKYDELNLRLAQVINRLVKQAKQQPLQLAHRLSRLSPNNKITDYNVKLVQLTQRLINAKHYHFQHKSDLFVNLIEQLQLVSPIATIARGYSVTRNADNKVINSIEQVAADDDISVQVSDGLIKAKVV